MRRSWKAGLGYAVAGQEPEAGNRAGRFLRRLWRSNQQRWLWLFSGVLLAWAVYNLVLGPHGALALGALGRRLLQEEAALESLKHQCDSLEAALKEASENRNRFLERIAREEYFFARPCERIYLYGPALERLGLQKEAGPSGRKGQWGEQKTAN